MSNCLYCQSDNPESNEECHHCGMLLPTETVLAAERRERRFIWFCGALTVFCLAMSIWLPRALF